MAGLKKGDKVVNIRDDTWEGVTIGQEYTILKIEECRGVEYIVLKELFDEAPSHCRTASDYQLVEKDWD